MDGNPYGNPNDNANSSTVPYENDHPHTNPDADVNRPRSPLHSAVHPPRFGAPAGVQGCRGEGVKGCRGVGMQGRMESALGAHPVGCSAAARSAPLPVSCHLMPDTCPLIPVP